MASTDKTTLYVPLNRYDVVSGCGQHYGATELGGPVEVYNFNVKELMSRPDPCTLTDRRVQATPPTAPAPAVPVDNFVGWNVAAPVVEAAPEEAPSIPEA